MQAAANALARVKQATKAKRRADEQYRAALVAAHDAGLSFADIAQLAGVSRQSVRILVLRALARD